MKNYQQQVSKYFPNFNYRQIFSNPSQPCKKTKCSIVMYGCKSGPQSAETSQHLLSRSSKCNMSFLTVEAHILLVSCRCSKSRWCLAPPEEHKYQKIYERKSRKGTQELTCGPGKPIFPGGPSGPCRVREIWEIATVQTYQFIGYFLPSEWKEMCSLPFYSVKDPRNFYICLCHNMLFYGYYSNVYTCLTCQHPYRLAL